MASGSPWALLRGLWGSLSPPGAGRWYLLLALRLSVLSFARGMWKGPPRDLLCSWAPPAPPSAAPGLRRLCAALCYNRRLPAPTAALWSLSLLLALLPVALRRLLHPPGHARHRGEGGRRPNVAAGDDNMAAGRANMAAEGGDSPNMAARGGHRPNMAANDDEWAAGCTKMAAGRANMAAGCTKMAAGRANMAAEGGGHPKMAAGCAKMAAGRLNVAAGPGDMAAGGAKMAAGQAKMAAGSAKVAAGSAKMAAGPCDPPGCAKMAAARAKMAAGADKMAAGRDRKMAAGPRPADRSTALVCADQWEASARPRPPRAAKMAAALHPPAPPKMAAGRGAASVRHDGRGRWRAWLWVGSAAMLAAGEGGVLWAVLRWQLPAVTALPIGCRPAAARCPPLACALPARADKMAALVGVAASAAASLLAAVADALVAAARAWRGCGPERAGPA